MSYATESPFTGEYNDWFEEGVYLCKRCQTPLYTSAAKFHSGCGWPSFDEEIPSSVAKRLDHDGRRIEITCAHCHAHLGHLFLGEHLTQKNTRHCVNSYALQFIPKKEVAYFGSGCFWCSEALFAHRRGVLSVTPGYSGGWVQDPSYQEVCTGTTGHAEVIRVEFDPKVISYEDLLELFWQSHDPTSLNRQGNDVGTQYRSIILYTDEQQKLIAEGALKERRAAYAAPIVTEIRPFEKFYEAEDYHKNYFEKNPAAPYCQLVIAPKLQKIRKNGRAD